MVDALVRACMRTPQAARYIAISKSRLNSAPHDWGRPTLHQDCSEARCLSQVDLDAWLESRVRTTE